MENGKEMQSEFYQVIERLTHVKHNYRTKSEENWALERSKIRHPDKID